MPIELVSSPSPDPCPQTVSSSSQLVPDASDGLSPDVATPPQDNEVVGRKLNPKYLQPPAKKGRRKDPVWDDVIVADDIVPCKKCEKIIHQLGKTHVERVRDHFKRKCPKRPVSKTITACFPPALGPVKIAAFQRQFALWFYSTGMAFNKVNHATLVKALAVLNPGAVLPTARELATTLLDSSYGELKLVMVHRVKGKKSTLVTDAWTDVNAGWVLCSNQIPFIPSHPNHSLAPISTDSESRRLATRIQDVRKVLAPTTRCTRAARHQVVEQKTAQSDEQHLAVNRRAYASQQRSASRETPARQTTLFTAVADEAKDDEAGKDDEMSVITNEGGRKMASTLQQLEKKVAALQTPANDAQGDDDGGARIVHVAVHDTAGDVHNQR
ncbi:hypothetical protein PI124_g18958 [Phytophthora idaei]|nr:hypothetical protein PI124_g18958 [Phytophthora idaei]